VTRGLFVTGTDTGVGKTVVSAALVMRLRSAGAVRYWKPIQTGIEQDDDTATVTWLAGCAAAELLTSGVRLPRPLSPHLAARLSGTAIDLAPLEDTFNEAAHATHMVVEGAGGALVPLNGIQLMTDLMARLNLPVVIAARSTIGTINHTLLTIEALQRRSLDVAGVVMVGPPNSDNRDAIEQYGSVPVLGEMPMFDPLTADRLSAWCAAEFDRGNRLLELLR
jgi:dethiobiotin synthase